MTSTSTTLADAQVISLRRLLQINVCALCCLAALIFAAAEGSPLALITLPIGFSALLYIDFRQAAGLPTLWANLLGLTGFVAAGVEFFSSIEGRLLGFAHLLVYFTWILLLQQKGVAQFWWLCALSVLQVATASVLTADFWFPLGAIVYMLLALWTLSVFSIDRAVRHSLRVVEAERATGDFTPPGNPSLSRANVRADATSRWLTPRFALGVLINGMLSLMLGVAIFVLVPRIWAGGIRIFGDEATEANQPLTGFAEEVRLGDLGEILENPNLVLEVSFRDNQTGERLNVESTMARLGYDVPLFRGKILGRYNNGRWAPPAQLVPAQRPRIPDGVSLIRQEFRLHPIGTRTLFTAGRAVGCRGLEGSSSARVTVEHDPFSDTHELDSSRRSRRALDREFDYEAFAAISGETIRPSGAGPSFWQLQGTYQQQLLALPKDMRRLRALTRQLLRTGDGTILSEADIAAALVDHLKTSGGYRYTLQVAVDDASIDPVEDFLFNRREGHCEYFASALALMLRSANIPARLVSGFKGGALNDSTGLYEVRQLHAHAWVEALIEDEWVVLDATPPDRDQSVALIDSATSPLTRLKQQMQGWWTQGLTLNQIQQRRMIYDPLQQLYADWTDSIRRVGLSRSVIAWLKELVTDPGEWISVGGFVTAFVLLSMISGVVWMGRRGWVLVRASTRRGARRQRQQRQMVAFYERFRALVARQGFVRDGEMTQQEFAHRIESDWSARPGVDGLADLPTRLTDAFYRVRFGHMSLAKEELQHLETSLSDLEAWVNRKQN